ncbi:MAG: endolytic transglycosylase MltG [Pacificimonas sp.]
MLRWLLIAVIAVGALIVGGLWLSAESDWTAPGPSAAATDVVIPQGATQTSALRLLEDRGVLSDADRTVLLARLFGNELPVRAGEFRFPAAVSASGVLDILQTATPIQRRITIPEGMPSVLVHERIMAAPYLTGDIDVPREGSVLPNTYNYERGETRTAVVERMQAAMDETLAELWAARADDIAVSTPEEAVTLAAIVEKETAKPSERRLVAGVYTNRLKQGIRLQADPTIIYPITKGRPLGRRILRSEIDAVNDYNTYSMNGLPKGPIANPGRASIAAVLDPEETDALFFVADGTGGHVFAKTLAEHNANVRKWFAIRRERGEM